MATKARVAITAENQMSKGLLEAKKETMEWSQQMQKISKTLSSAFSFATVAVGLKAVSGVVRTTTNELKKLTSTAAKLTKDVTKTATSWVKGYEEMRLTYERLKLSLSDQTDYNYVVNSIDTLAKSTTIAKEELESMASELAQLGKSAKEIDKISSASVYLSTVTGGDLNTSMQTILNTYNGVTTKLDKLGLNMKKFTKEELANGAAVDEIIDKYEKLNNEIAGNSLKQAMTNLLEVNRTVADAIGGALSDYITPVIKKVSDALADITETFSLEDGRMDLSGLFKLIKTFVNSLTSQLNDAFTSGETYQKIINFVSKLVKAIVPIIASGITMAISASKAALNSAGLAKAQNNLSEDRIKYDDYVASLLKKYKASSLDAIPLKDYEEKKLTQLQQNIDIGIEEVERKTNQVVNNVNKAIEPAIQYIGTELPKSFEACKDAAKDLGTIIPNLWQNAFTETENSLKEYRRSLVSIAPEMGTNRKASTGLVYNINTQDRGWYGKMLVNTQALYDEWEKLDDKLNTEVVPRITEPFSGITSQLDTITELSDQWLSENKPIEQSVNSFFKMTRTQLMGLSEGLEVETQTAEEIGKSIVQIGNATSIFQQIKDYLFGYNTLVTTKNEDGSSTTEEQFVNGLFNVLGETGEQDFTTMLTTVIDSLGVFGDMIMGMNPLIAVLKPVIEGFVNVMSPMIETVLLPLQSTLTYIGEMFAGIFAPILDKLAPVIQTIANVLMSVIQPVLTIMQQPLLVIATLLEILSPILDLVSQAFNYLLIPIKAVAATLQWFGNWVRYIVLSIYNWISWIWGGTVENEKPGSWSDYYDAMSTSTSFSTGSEGVATEIAEGMINGTSTSTGVTNASYSGGGSVTMNIYVNAPLVGSNGMEEFAIMLREEFEAIGYYNVA